MGQLLSFYFSKLSNNDKSFKFGIELCGTNLGLGYRLFPTVKELFSLMRINNDIFAKGILQSFDGLYLILFVPAQGARAEVMAVIWSAG